GIADLALVAGPGVRILQGNGDGTFQAARSYVVSSDPNLLAVGDFNRDGIADLAVTSASAGSVTILLGKGDGTFQTAPSYATGSTAISVAEGDFNADGTPDLAVANAGTSSNPGSTVSILLGKG